MHHRISFLLCLLFSSGVILLAQPTNTFQSAVTLPSGALELHTTKATVTIMPYSVHTLGVTYEPTGYENPPSYAVAPQTVTIKPEYIEDTTTITWQTEGWTVTINKDPFLLSYAYHDRHLLAEAPGYISTDTTRGFRFRIAPGEKWMGGGERALGMDRTGQRLTLYNTPSYGYETERDLMYYSLPIAISSRKYMVVFDNGARGYLSLGATDPEALQMEAIGGRLSYLIVAGDTWPDLATHFTGLTGRQPMLPRWGYGNISSRFGYHSQAEAEAVIDRYEEDDIPVDAIVFDIFWFGKTIKGTLGNFAWYRDSFPDPEGMMADFTSQGVQTILITEPFVLENTHTYQAVLDKGLVGFDSTGAPYHFDFYFGTGTLLDVFNPHTVAWWWRIYRDLTASGVSGWWGDLGEPEAHPDDLLHVNGRADHIHNLYGHAWARLVYEGMRRDFPERRPLILMRSGFVGSQRYGMVPWSGDVSRTWGGMQSQVEIALQMGLQGLGYMHSDLGGFAGDNRDAELYTRWLQYGVFQPVFRPHAQEAVPSEPIFWDAATKAIARDYIRLRYRLLPYLYTLAWQNATQGLPMMRPLFYLEDDPALIDNQRTYLWGDAFLVSPVTKPGVTEWSVYLPQGHTWIDYWTGQSYMGGQTVSVPLTLKTMPVFVRAGSFVPMVEPVNHTADYRTDALELHYYDHASAKNSSWTWYEDDGHTPQAWQKEAYELLHLSSLRKNRGLTIRLNPERYAYQGMPRERLVELVIHGIEAPGGRVRLDNKRLSPKHWSYDGELLRIRVPMEDGPREVQVRW